MNKQDTLLVDVGNSSVKWSETNHSDVHFLSLMSHELYPENITAAFFIKYWEALDKKEHVFVSCVAKNDVWQAILQASEHLWGIQAERVASAKEGFGLVNAYDKYADLGSDRWCAIIGAHHKAKSDVIVISCGSAITIDIVSSTGIHLGGYILPGLTMMKQSLGTNTADVKVDLEHRTSILKPANSTAGCVDSAVNLAVKSFIESVYEQQAKQTGTVECLIAGGDALFVAEWLSIKYDIVPDIVLRGLAYIADAQLEN